MTVPTPPSDTPPLDAQAAGAPRPGGAADAAGEVRAAARDGEPDRYLAALLAPTDAREALLAIAGFAAEVGRIAADVREPMIGEIRLQWWRDAIDAGGRGEITGHPVADLLAVATRRHGLPATAMHRMIDARSADVARAPPEDDAALDDHLAATEGLAFALGVAVLSGADAAAAPALRQAGIAYGLARRLGRLPLLLARGSPPIPASRLTAAGLTLRDLDEQPPSGAVAAGVETVARGLELRARAALDDARGALGPLLPRALPALLPLAMVEPYFAAQNRPGYVRLTMLAEPLPIIRPWRIWLARHRGRP